MKKLKLPTWDLPRWRHLGTHYTRVPLGRTKSRTGVFAIRKNTVKADDGTIVCVGMSSADPVHDTDLHDAILQHIDLGKGPKPVEPSVTRSVAEICYKRLLRKKKETELEFEVRLRFAVWHLRRLLGLNCPFVDDRGAPCLRAPHVHDRDHTCAVRTDGTPVASISDYEHAARLGLIASEVK